LALGLARDIRVAAPARSAFAQYASSYAEVVATGRENGLDPLVAHYGPAVLDRAILDAVCRAYNLSFPEAIRANLPGVHADGFASGLDGFDMDRFLAGLPFADSIHARHTVGMADRLTAADGEESDRVNDGLPETLEEVVAAYGQNYFKIKILRDRDENVQRMRDIAGILDRIPDPYVVTVDGNELYEDVEGVAELWDAMVSAPGLERFTKSTLWIEQPISRQAALDVDVSVMKDRCPVMIDESDADIEAFPRARDMGYRGVSSKICKGFYKSILNAARCKHWNRTSGEGTYFLSGEDLTCQAGVCMQQDLALMTLLGTGQVEKNGHHFGRGMEGAPPRECEAFLAAHPDLYENRNGNPCLRITDGRVSVKSLNCAGFGCAAEPDWKSLAGMALPTGV
ncbi:MAG: mandelate racemase, partial [Rhodospirillales bacterium]|nr:mandelate racemase [Rhodospirillales bacterium]